MIILMMMMAMMHHWAERAEPPCKDKKQLSSQLFHLNNFLALKCIWVFVYLCIKSCTIWQRKISELTKRNRSPFILFQSKRSFEDGKEGARGGGWPSIYAGE